MFALAVLCLSTSCDGGETTPPGPNASLAVTTPAEAPAEGGEVTFDVTSDVEWKIASVADRWITSVTPATGTGDGTVTLTLAANTVEAPRTSTVTVTGGGLTREVEIAQQGIYVEKLVDRLVGTWISVGDYVREFTPSKDQHIVTIEKIDNTTVRIIDLLGVATLFSNMTSEQDTFTATVDNEAGTISIASQPIEPTFDLNGWPVYLCRFLNDYADGFADNWKVGFENIPVSPAGIIDFAKGGWQVGNWGGKPAHASFVPLTQDPSDGKVYTYNWYFTNTVWTKQRAVE
jgi:hypothetical protein